MLFRSEDRPGLSISTTLPEKLEAAPLYYAARFGICDLAAHLLAEHPEDVHAEGGFEMTPLYASAYHGHFNIFSILVEHFPNLDIKGDRGRTPLLLASWGTHLEMGELLLDHGADANASDDFDRTPLFIAAWSVGTSPGLITSPLYLHLRNYDSTFSRKRL